MRNNVTFHYPAEFISAFGVGDVLSVEGAGWFVSVLQRINSLSVQGDLCQEDWGVVVFVARGGKRFWVGLSFWPEGEQKWLAHFHHRSFAWLQRWSASGGSELDRLISDFHSALASEPLVRGIAWHHERDMQKAHPPSTLTPNTA